jgi:glycosyltransferase involved in cell wall biosynthesis
LIVALNATSFDGRPSGARTRAVGIAAALLRAGHMLRVYVPEGASMGEDLARELGGPVPGDLFEQNAAPLYPAHPVRRAIASRRWFDRRVTRDTDVFVTDYYPVLTRVPTFVTVHDLRYFAARQYEPAARAAYFRAVFGKIARRAAGVVVPTRAVAAEAAEFLGVADERVRVVGNGLSRAWRRAPPADGRGAHLLAVGMTERRKDLPTLLAALRRAPAAPPLVVVARGRAPSGARDLVAAGRVRFAGEVDDAGLVELCRGAAALLHPSRYEGFGLPVIEAMSLGVPVLAARQPAVEEVAGGFATLLPPGDADAWAAAMSRVAPPPPGARAYACAFSWDTAAAALVAPAARRAPVSSSS